MATTMDPVVSVLTQAKGEALHTNIEPTHEQPGSASLLELLAEDIAKNASVVSEFLRTAKKPQPSFERDSPVDVLPADAPDGVRKARVALMESSLRAFQLAMGPKEYIPNLSVNVHYLAALRWLTHFDVLRNVPLTGSISYFDLSIKAKVSIKQLKTVARMAMTNNLLHEISPDVIAHTATSAMLVQNPSMHDWAEFLVNTTAPAADKLAQASEKWSGSVAKNETAYNIAFDTTLPFFDHLATLPSKTHQFASYMKHVQQSEGTALRHLVTGFDWASVGSGKVVDVGGSSGATCAALAQAFPELTFEVQDLAVNVEEGRTAVASLGRPTADRISFRAHDFFGEQPVARADIYLLRMILHDWPDQEAQGILTQLSRALGTGTTSRILIMDTVLPAPGSMPSSQERLLRARDMTMLSAFNSLERDLTEWQALLASAEPPLGLRNVLQPAGSVLSILVVERAVTVIE